jgi:hypothetical protein
MQWGRSEMEGDDAGLGRKGRTGACTVEVEEAEGHHDGDVDIVKRPPATVTAS